MQSSLLDNAEKSKYNRVMFDRIFKNGIIIDGTGNPAFPGDIGVSDGKIILSPEGEAREEIDVSGKYICPGFIDSHSHMDRHIGKDTYEEAVRCRITQGITTEMTGMCGSTLFPVEDTDAFFERAEETPKYLNYAFMTGHGTVRTAVMGFRGDAPSSQELREMKAYIREGMDKGCFGFTSGLIYVPGVYADTEELIELTKEISPYGGIYATHMRSEADRVEDGVREAILVAKEAGVPLFISHHKAMGKANWGKSVKTLALIHEAIRNGQKITIDQYPYTASMSSIMNSIPPEYFTEGKEAFAKKLADPELRKKLREQMTAKEISYNSGLRNAGGFDRIMIASVPGEMELTGKTIAELASELGKDPFDVYFDLLMRHNCEGYGIFFAMSEEDMERIYLDENTCVGSDATFTTAEDHVHPRAYGTFVRSLCYFHKKRGLVTLEEAVRKQTSLTADRWGLAGKGRIADGYDADLVVFDYDNLSDGADFVHPKRTASGIEGVYVAGEPVYVRGRMTGKTPGKCIYRRDL